MTSAFRNVHLRQPAPALRPDQILPRLRVVTNDPAREYAQRPGEVEPLPDSVAALILCKQEFRPVGRNGITIEFEGRKYKYWSEHSITIATKAGTKEKVLCTFNRRQPDMLHILTAAGQYVESIPQEGKAQWFKPEDLQILGAKKRANQRRIDRIAELHAPDAEAALERELENETQLKGLVQTFPASDRQSRVKPSTTRIPEQSLARRENLSREGSSLEERPVHPLEVRSAATAAGLSRATDRKVAGSSPAPRSSFPRAERLHEIQRTLGQQRAAHQARQERIAQRVAAINAGTRDNSTNSPDGEVGAVLTATRATRRRMNSDWGL